MTAFLIVLAVLSVAGIAASAHLVRTDGYGPVPDRLPPERHRLRRAGASDASASRLRPLRRPRRGWNSDANAAQTR